MSDTKTTISDATRKAVLKVLEQQKGDFSSRKWGTTEHAMGIAYLADLVGIGSQAVIPPGTPKEKVAELQAVHEKATRKEFTKEWVSAWTFASNLAKRLAHEDIKLIPAKAATPTGEYE